MKILDLQQALNGRRLCENTVGLLEEKGVANWHERRRGRQDRVGRSRCARSRRSSRPYQLQEDSHPSYWGQKAMRNCLRQAYNGGAVRGGTCVRSANGLNAQGEPNMLLQ